MATPGQTTPHAAVTILQHISAALVAAAGLALVAASVAAALGVLPWLSLPLTFGDATYPAAGVWVQVGLAVLLVALASFLPATHRVLSLERSHRDFQICMSDVADAYAACHAADRADTFRMAGEFDSVKERILFLRRHPDLGNLEPDVLEAAAEMSQASRELARIYSDENVARARAFLDQRQQEIETFRDRIAEAHATFGDLERRLRTVEGEERAMDDQLAQLERTLGDTLDKLGFQRRRGARPEPAPNVIALPAHAAE